jgi:hypothetical protein
MPGDRLSRRSDSAMTNSDDWPTVTAEAISLLHLRDCDEQLSRSDDEPIRLAQAAKSAHLALQAALIAALSGSLGIGAYDAKLEQRWLAALQDGAPWPESHRVMDFDGLLAKARQFSIEWRQEPLQVTDEEAAALSKLTNIRHGIEHPKPGFWVIEPAYIYLILPIAVQLAVQLLEAVRHHFEPDEIELAVECANHIQIHCQAAKRKGD